MYVKYCFLKSNEIKKMIRVKVMLYFASPTTMLHYVQLYNLYYDTKSSDTALFLVVNTPSHGRSIILKLSHTLANETLSPGGHKHFCRHHIVHIVCSQRHEEKFEPINTGNWLPVMHGTSLRLIMYRNG